MLAWRIRRWDCGFIDTHSQKDTMRDILSASVCKVTCCLSVKKMCDSSGGTLINAIQNEALEALMNEWGEVPSWNTTPSSFQARLPCSTAEWWRIQGQSPDLAHSQQRSQCLPNCSWSSETMHHQQSSTHKHGTHWQSCDRWPTTGNTVPVSLFTLQATWLVGHFMTDCGARGPDCICVMCDHEREICCVWNFVEPRKWESLPLLLMLMTMKFHHGQLFQDRQK